MRKNSSSKITPTKNQIFKFTDEDLKELDDANSNAARSTTIADSQISTSPPARFTASALVLITFCHVNMVLAVTSTNSPFISGLCAGLLGIFVGHWILIRGTGLSRRSCCFIDEASVLRPFNSNWSPFVGNVFSVIEPPTPNGSNDCCDQDIGEEDEGGGVMKILGDAMAQSMPYSDNEKRFDQIRHDYYGDMEHRANKAAKEMGIAEIEDEEAVIIPERRISSDNEEEYSHTSQPGPSSSGKSSRRHRQKKQK